MYIEDQLWIADALGVNLPMNYLVETTNFPFLEHEGTDHLPLWDDAEAIIKATKAYRTNNVHPWPNEWVCIGKHELGPYAMNCITGDISIAKDGDLNDIGDRFYGGSVKGIVDKIHNGYKGKLPYYMPRKDSSFKPVNILEKIPWQAGSDLYKGHPYDHGVLFRVHHDSSDLLVQCLKRLRIHLIEVDGAKMSTEEDLFLELERAINYTIDGWTDLTTAMIEHLQPISAGGLMQTAIVWKQSDITMAQNPHLFVDACAYFEQLDLYNETGSTFISFYTGSDENYYKARVDSAKIVDDLKS